jgi:phosphoribosylanthranilate isomerase
MPRTRIKICGICRPQDATAATHAGADAIGIVFHAQSPRFVTVDQARQIIANVPPFISVVGLFVDADLATIRRTTAQISLSAIQLQGNESPKLVAELHPTPVIKAIKIDRNAEQTFSAWKAAIADLKLTNLIGLLLETSGTLPGGSGIPNDWSAIQRLQRTGIFKGLPPLIAAGGLTPQTVGEIARLIRPYAVDVSSGVESARREKSSQKIQAFVQAVRSADGMSQ